MIGTPQTRWREMHQSGRVAIMFEMRSSPHAGVHFTLLIASSAFCAQVVVVHADEPLFGGAEDGRLVAAPAMRIAVLDVAPREQRAVFFRISMTIGLPSQTVLPISSLGQLCPRAFGLEEASGGIDRAINRQAVLRAR